VQRLGRRDADPAPLARRESPEALVPAELGAVLAHDRAGGRGEAVACEEVPVVAAGEEARLLALRARGDGKAGGARLGAHVVLRALAEREGDALKEARVETGEHVRLVLAPVGRAREKPSPLVAHRTGVVPGHESLRARAAGEREQLGEAERAVAAHAGIRSLAARERPHERPDDGAPELLAEI